MRIPRIPVMTKWGPAFVAVLALALLPSMAITGDKPHHKWESAESLISAADSGDITEVKRLLEEGADVNGTGRLQQRALPCAAAKGHLEIVMLLLERGADIEAPDQDGLTPLMNACEQGRLETARLLLDKGADVNAQTKNGSTALRKAVNEQHLEVIRLLLARGADVNVQLNDGFFVLMLAAMTGDRDVVGEILQGGADISARDKQGFSALTWAAVLDNAAVVKLLQSRGAKSDLWVAVLTGDIDEARRLINAGADVNVADGQGLTLLMHAARKGLAHVVELLLAKGADPAPKHMERYAESPIVVGECCGYFSVGNHFASVITVDSALRGGSLETVAMLLRRGDGILSNARADNWTVLQAAILFGRVDVVKLLLSNGLDVNMKIGADGIRPMIIDSDADFFRGILHLDSGFEGMSPLMLACIFRRVEIAKFLVANGADVNQRNRKRETALMWATLCGPMETVKLLLANGADINAVDYVGSSVLNRACEGPIRELLLARGAKGGERGDRCLISWAPLF